jgi:hypothetical protein
MSLCRDCRAPIVWAGTDRPGFPMPLDRAPIESSDLSGLYVLSLTERDEGGQILTAELDEHGDRPGPHYRSHRVTCPVPAWQRQL